MKNIRLSWVLSTFVVLLFQLPNGTPSRILLMPYPYKSHITRISNIGKELLVNGHEVHILLPASYPELGHVSNKSGFTVVEYVVKEPDLYTMLPQTESDVVDWIDKALKLSAGCVPSQRCEWIYSALYESIRRPHNAGTSASIDV